MLDLPNLVKFFVLYVSERNKRAVSILTQDLGSCPRPVAYLSKQLDGITKSWPPCLRALAATAMLVQETDKLTLGQNLKVWVPHAVVILLNAKGHHWLTNAHLAKYQSLLCENSRLTIEMCTTLNLVTLLPVKKGELQHNYLEVLGSKYSSRPDLLDQPIRDPD